ncbi:Lrp/AsnC family transcriptional regulator [Mycobacteriaceae bacterium NPDC060252]
MKSDMFDRLDRQLLHALQLDGRAPFSKIAQALEVSDQTVARRYRRLCTTAHMRVLGTVNDGLLQRPNWILRMQVAAAAAEQLAETLSRRPDTAYILLISGGTELVCSMQPLGLSPHEEPLLERLHRTPQITSVTAHCVLNNFYCSDLGWLEKNPALTPEQVAALTPPPRDNDDTVQLDTIDGVLLSALQRDGRAALGDLESAAGISESAVRRRIEAMRRSGVLHFDVQYNPTVLGRHTQAMLWLTVAPSRLHDVGTALAQHPEVTFAAAITGQTNLAVDAVFRGTDELYGYLTDQIGTLSGVLATETCLVQRKTKQLTYEPRVIAPSRNTTTHV